jgi:small subunit ribosomal protein S5
MKKIDLVGDTIPHELEYKFGAAKILLRPAKPGTGVIAGSSVRTVLELTGIEDVYAKLLGSNDPIANTYCAYEALLALRSERVLKQMKNMRERIEIKKEKEKERKKRESKQRSNKSEKAKTTKKQINKKSPKTKNNIKKNK